MSFDYAILGGGCAGLSLAYQLETQGRLQNRTLVIVEPREHYRRDKTWSFWKVRPHDFEDCVIQQWQRFQVRAEGSLQSIDCGDMPYQSIDSGLFYDKVLKALKVLKVQQVMTVLKDRRVQQVPMVKTEKMEIRHTK